ncbi:hypothetical protein AOQ84DRAFT_292365 [Glonium stellatum]|uniref:Uncharacterized protein n=1 Tax=Glonium stellatum TaxID=574774 RepID=A0A8E2F208_9PEZI|nr:hypothetical protein AOQ84DRAFT_292365 [Glonium stellatum]
MSSTSVYTGFWVDHSRGAVFGATLTVPIQYGSFIITSLTVLISMSAASAWQITAYVLHQARVKKYESDGLDLQLQVLLQNSDSPASTIFNALKFDRAWRNLTSRVHARVLAIVVSAFAVWVTFLLAGIFVAAVASSSNQEVTVLAQPGACGMLEFNNATLAGFNSVESKFLNDTISARAYARDWYSGSSGNIPARSIFPVVRLPYKTNTAAPCPFNGRCLMGENSALSLDTSLLDSHYMLGINAPAQDRISWRNVVTCSPVNVSDFVLIQTSPTTNRTYENIYIGPFGFDNMTFSYNIMPGLVDGVGYQLSVVYSEAGLGGTWTPIPEFNRTDADISAFFLAQNDIVYSQPILDPMFLANGTYTETRSAGKLLYKPNNLVNVLACANQQQICGAYNSSCTSLSSLMDIVSELAQIGLNKAQLAAAGRMTDAAEYSNIYHSIFNLDSGALLASELIFYGVSPGLPSNQWQIEVENWFRTSLAKAQASVVSFVNQPTAYAPYITVDRVSAWPSSQSDKQANLNQCSNQRIQNLGTTQNFSFFGVMLVVTTSVLLITLGIALEPAVSRYREWRRSWAHKGEHARQADDMIQLLRMALENSGQGPWRKGAWDVPVSKRGAVFNLPASEDTELARHAISSKSGIADSESLGST